MGAKPDCPRVRRRFACSPHLVRDRERVAGDAVDQRCDVVAARFEHGEGCARITVRGRGRTTALRYAPFLVLGSVVALFL
jgi:hypothetical protein